MEATRGGEGPLGAETARAGQPLTPRHVHGTDTARGSQSQLHGDWGLVATQQGRILPSSEVSRQRENARGPDPGASRWTHPGLLDAPRPARRLAVHTAMSAREAHLTSVQGRPHPTSAGSPCRMPPASSPTWSTAGFHSLSPRLTRGVVCRGRKVMPLLDIFKNPQQCSTRQALGRW